MSSQQSWTPAAGPWEPAQPVKARRSAITPDTTLAVIDMQMYYFEKLTQEAFDVTFRAVMREIDDAIAVGAPVVIVEFAGCGKSHPEIYRRIKGYMGRNRHAPVIKGGWSGGHELVKSCKRRGYPTEKFRLCGIFTGQCVHSTAWTLAHTEGVDDVRVVVDACCECSTRSQYDWAHYDRSPRNLKLVRQTSKRKGVRKSSNVHKLPKRRALPERELLRAAA
jgi:nicotinamidase-related amidase